MGEPAPAVQPCYRVLGAVAVHHDTTGWQAVPAAKQRLLLAVLLARGSQLTPVDLLVDELWGRDAPANAAKAVHNYVLRLRRLLRDPHGERIITHRPGYRLPVRSGEVDADLVGHLISVGRAQLRTGQPASAQQTLARAARLWHGRPLEDVTHTRFIAGYVDRLESLRLDLLEARADAGLAMGPPPDLAIDLANGAHTAPLRETLWARYVRVLHALGRPADAVAAYQQVARHLREELGLAPGAELRGAYRSVLDAPPSPRSPVSHAAAATVPASGGAGTGAPPAGIAPAPQPSAWRQEQGIPLRPRQVPRDLSTFAGRDGELATLLGWLAPAGKAGGVAIISGPGGVGKSALANRAAHRLSGYAPDGQLHVDLHGQDRDPSVVPAQAVLDSFLRALGVPPGQIPAGHTEAQAMYRTMTAGRRLLVILDNAASAGQVAPLLPSGSASITLVTSRAPLALEDAHRLALDVLPVRDAASMLGRYVGPDRAAAQPQCLHQLAELCGRLPLALRIAGARLAGRPEWPVNRLVERLADERHRLDELRVDDLAVRGSIQLSYRMFEPTSAPARTFRSMALTGCADLPEPAVSALIGEPAGPALDELGYAQLVQEHEPGRYRMHDLTRLVARELAQQHEPAPAQAAARTRLADHYLSAAQEARTRLRPAAGGPGDPEYAAALEWFDTERANLLAIVTQADPADPAQARSAVLIARAAAPYFRVRMRLDDLADSSGAAIRLSQAIGDLAGQAQALDDHASACFLLGRYPEAAVRLEEALRIVQQLGDPTGQARRWGNLGIVLNALRDYPRAAYCQDQAWRGFGEIGDRIGQSRALNNLGEVYLDCRRYRSAFAALAGCLTLCQENNDLGGEAVALGSLGLVLIGAGQPEKARPYLQYGLFLHRHLGGVQGQAICLQGLAETHRQAGRFTLALMQANASLALARRSGWPPGTGRALLTAGLAHLAEGRTAAGQDCLRQALATGGLMPHESDQAREALAG
ncbi:BTAD domain-containing putative transcriptional regulator [Dactylosporangium sp. NPDC048998]|uniref:AfsR/SARP family transcriptional regulator n=1 Tax=Dactylosporangium sp. NPDC048998 TaxID=3363976 RepID=UPI00371D2291